METALDTHSTPRETVQAALKRIRAANSPRVHQAAIDVLAVLELQDSQNPQRIVDEVQTRPDLESSNSNAIETAIRVLGIHGLVWHDTGSDRVALTALAASCLSEARER